MTQWYCRVGETQYGPVPEETLQEWIAVGRVAATDYVWAEGMPNWEPASAFFTCEVRQDPNSMVCPRTIPGTGGATPNAQLAEQARSILRGRWGLPIGFSLLSGLISGAGGNIPVVGPLISLAIAGPLQLGVVIFFLTVVRGRKGDIGMLFAGFKNFGNALGAYLLMVLAIIGGLLLLIVPGIIFALAYSQTFYLLAENRSMGPVEALRASWNMMKGYKGKLFCLGLRFFGWALLCILTCGIGFLWLGPYMATSYARFYEDLHSPAGTVQPVVAPAAGPAAGPVA